MCSVIVICPFTPYGLAHWSETCQIRQHFGQTLRTHIFETTGWMIYAIWSSKELRRPVVVQHHGQLTFTWDFQGQMLYLKNGKADWYGTKGIWVDRMLRPLCDFQRSPHPWPWPWISYLRNGMADWHGIKMDVRRYNGGPMLWLSMSTWPVNLTLDFQGQILKMLCHRNGRADWHGMKGMWVDRMLHTLCDFQLWLQPWPWPWIFKVKFWKSRISGMGWPIDMESKGCELECWTHVVTFNVHLFRELDLGFSRSNLEKAISQEWDGRLTWNERDVGR